MNDTPKRYVQVFANYDKSFVNKVHSLVYYSQDRSGNDVSYNLPCVFATPDRAFAQMRSQIARKKGVDIKTIENIPIPLPIASLTRLTPKVDLTRFVQYKFTRLFYAPQDDTYIGMERPNPWDIPYQIDIWARTMQDLDELTNQINLWLRADEIWPYLEVDHPFPMNRRIVLAQLQNVNDISKVDQGDETKRLLRRTFTFIVHGWIVHQPVEAPIIRKVIVDFYDDTDLPEAFLDRITVTTGTQLVVPPVPQIPVLPEDTTMGNILTTLYGLLIVGDATAGQDYGGFQVPAASRITGMSATVLGDAPTGNDLELQFRLNGVVDSANHVVVQAGTKTAQVIFGQYKDVVAGDVLSVHCLSAGSILPGNWVEVRFDTTISVSI